MTQNRWFSLFDVACVGVSILLVEWIPHSGGIPYLIACLPWILRVFAGQFPFLRSWFDVLPLVFLVTAWIGGGSAYNLENFWSKWWLLIGGVLIYYSLLWQPKKNLWPIVFLISLCGAIMAGFFLLTNDWQAYPAKIDFINQIGLWWMTVRPGLFINSIYHNSAAGVIALTAPYTIIIGVRGLQKKSLFSEIWALIIGAMLLIGLTLTTSRGAVLAIFFGFGVWIIKILMQNYFPRHPTPWMNRIGPGLILAITLAAGLIIIFLAGAITSVPNVTVLSSSGSRLGLFADSLRLVEDFPLIGAGLNAFSGVYSYYILSVPVLFFENGHNLFLNVAVEQGIIGALVLCWVYYACIRTLVKNDDRQTSLIVGATLASLVIIVLHNLVDNVVDETFLAPILFIIPGMARALAQPETIKRFTLISLHKVQLHLNVVVHPTPSPAPPGAGSKRELGSFAPQSGAKLPKPLSLLPFPAGRGQGDGRTCVSTRRWGGTLHNFALKLKEFKFSRLVVCRTAIAVIIFISIFLFRNELISAWYSNLGANQMARVELAGFPTHQWDTGQHLAAFVPAENNFLQSLRYNPNNRTANQRLGLIAMQQQDFASAITYLIKAYQVDPGHREIWKSLGYAYVWTGQYDRALPLLQKIPEAQQELGTYSWWWTVQNRTDLSANAAFMLKEMGTK